MAFMSPTFESRPDWNSLSQSKSPESPERQIHSRMPPSRETTSPRSSRPGQIPLRAHDGLFATSPGQASMRAFHPGDYSKSIRTDHMDEEQLRSMSASPHVSHQSPPHHHISRPGSRKRRHAADYSGLLAIGSWSSPIDFDEGHHAGFSSRSDFVGFEDEPSFKHARYDDFILFHDGNLADTYERPSAYGQRMSAPMAPHVPRLRTPDVAPLSTDVQFFPCVGDEAEEDRINESWYLAGRERVDLQRQYSPLDPTISTRGVLPHSAGSLNLPSVSDALSYMAGVEGRGRQLRD